MKNPDTTPAFEAYHVERFCPARAKPRSLIIPDIHQTIPALDKLLTEKLAPFPKNSSPFQEVIFLGDWFDTHLRPGSAPSQVASFKETCLFLKSLLTRTHPLFFSLPSEETPSFVFILGNHDLPYIYANKPQSFQRKPSVPPLYSCSGFSRNKASAFCKIFAENGLLDDFFLHHFVIAHSSEGWTFSHAGLSHPHLLACMRDSSPSYSTPTRSSTKNPTLSPLPHLQLAWKGFRTFRPSLCESPHDPDPLALAFAACGRSRGGLSPCGGPLWCDWHQEFKPSPLIGKQIFGHTEVSSPQVLDLHLPTESWNIDVPHHYAILSEGNLSLHHFAQI